MLAASLGALVDAPTTAAAAPTQFNVRIRTFDSEFLDATVFLPAGATANSTPFVIMTHGWASSRVTTQTGRVADLLAAGYGVLTWDSRGFGNSTGEVMLDSPAYEVRDVSSILTWIADNVPQAKLQSRRDPLVGMSGGSYAGGIQLLAAAFDHRIDAIAPEITWNDLTKALAPQRVPKLAWTTALFAGGEATACRSGAGVNVVGLRPSTGCTSGDLARWFAEVHASGSVPADVESALELRSPKNYLSSIDAPTLLVQGSVDTLFDVGQAAANYRGLKSNGTTVKLWIYDGGHALPGTSVPNTQGALISPLVVTWMDRWLKGDVTVDTGPEVEAYVGGAWRSMASWPDPPTAGAYVGGIPALLQGPVTAGPPASFDQPIAPGPLSGIGPAHVSFDVSGTATEAFVFLSFAVETNGTRTRIDGQVQPTRVALPPAGAGAHVEADLIPVAIDVPAGSTLVLELTTSEPLFDGNRAVGFVNVVHIDVDWTAS
ncbi:MAG TPA: CocE/NonD family hydrolase [Candidatus Thermoplasmatota archaeon]|nr:CocE/NonD family hydrolase [Candidatus Thermoplasmatota archaeon]